MPSLFRLPKPVAVSGSQTYAGSKLYFYVTGTTTPADVYTNSGLTITHANPVEADADGVFEPIWLDPEVTYKLTWKTSAGALIYTVDPVSDSLTQDEIGRALYPRTAAEVTAGVTPTDYGYEPGDIRRYGTITTSSGFVSAWNAMVSTGHRGFIPNGAYTINGTLSVPLYADVHAETKREVSITISGAASDTVVIDLTNTSSRSRFVGIRFYDGTPNTCIGIKIKDELTGAGGAGANWKNEFVDCDFTNFKTGIWLTSATPLVGTNHSWCSEGLWLNCKFYNVRTGIICENIQSVNNTFVATDFENDDVGEQYTFIDDRAGGDFKFIGGSIIGRGKLYKQYYDSAGTTLFQGARVEFSNVRFEWRSTHNGVLFEQVAGTKNAAQEVSICIRGGQANGFGQTIDLLRYAGRLTFLCDGLDVLNTAELIIQQYPTDGFTAYAGATLAGSQGSVIIRDTSHVTLNVNTSSAYGTYSANRLGRVLIDSRPKTGHTYSIPTDSFLALDDMANIDHLGHGLQVAQPRRMIYEISLLTSGMTDVKFKLPKHARPLKAFIFKDFTRRTETTTYEVYIVKDNADWAVPGTFAYATDGVLAATIATTNPSSGYFEAVINVGTAIGSAFKVGAGSWTEGRIYFRKTSGANNHAGYVGIEYL